MLILQSQLVEQQQATQIVLVSTKPLKHQVTAVSQLVLLRKQRVAMQLQSVVKVRLNQIILLQLVTKHHQQTANMQRQSVLNLRQVLNLLSQLVLNQSRISKTA